LNDIDRFKYSFQNALIGLKTALGTQRNLRIHLLVGLLIIIFSVILKVTAIEFVLILLTILIVLVTEVFNTAIEFTIDLVSPEFNHLAKKVKDISAAGVLISAIIAALVGLIILGPKIYFVFSMFL